jgi:sugar phosphate isomerase/epimerase
VGAGIIDWKAIYAARKEAGIKYWFVEHDQPADPMQSLAASYQYMSALD